MELLRLLFKESVLKTIYLLLVSVVAGICGGIIIPLVIHAAEEVGAGRMEISNIILLIGAACLLIGAKRLSQQQIAFLVGGLQEKLVLKIANNIRHASVLAIENEGRREDIYLKIVNARVITHAATKNIETFQNVITILICWLYIFILSHQMGFILLAAFFIAVTVYELFQKVTEPFMFKESDAEKAMHHSFSHFLEGFKELKMNRRRSDELFHHYLAPLIDQTQKVRTRGMTYFSDFHLFMVSSFFVVLGAYAFLFTSPESHALLMKVMTVTLYMATPSRAIIVSIPYILNGKNALARLNRLASTSDEDKDDEWFYQPDREGRERFQTLTLNNIRFAYPHRENSNGFCVGPLKATLEAGKLHFITGGNGCGKSTLLKLITGLYEPDGGSFAMDGAVVKMANERHRFSAIFSDFHLFNELHGLDAIDPARVRNLLAKMELSEKTRYEDNRFTHIDLSNGQKKRLALIAMLLEDKPILVFDEWAADQAPRFRQYFYEELLPSFTAQGKTVIAVTHDDNYFHAADRMLAMEDGKIAAANSEVE